MNYMENRPMPCSNCGAMAQGRESSTNTKDGVLHECRWICHLCGILVKLHEEFESNEAK